MHDSPNVPYTVNERLVTPKFLIFINPMAGSQHGVSTFETYVKPMLDHAEIDYTVEITGTQQVLAACCCTWNLLFC